jgi:hypothetical protein
MDDPTTIDCKMNCVGTTANADDATDCIIEECSGQKNDDKKETDPYSQCVLDCKIAYQGDDTSTAQCIDKCNADSYKSGANTKSGCPACPLKCDAAEACEQGEFRCNGNSKKVLVCLDGHWKADSDYEGYCVAKIIKAETTAKSPSGKNSGLGSLFKYFSSLFADKKAYKQCLSQCNNTDSGFDACKAECETLA